MTSPSWQLTVPVSALVFDCDGTLSSIKGLDLLAKNNGVSDAIQSLLATGLSHDNLYQQQLDLVFPRREQVYALGHQYFNHRVPDISDVINLFQRLNKSIYLMSSCVNPAVKMFGEMLQIPCENIFAVDLRFDQQGNFLDYEHSSPMINRHGKREVVQQIKNKHSNIIHIGDGNNEIMTLDLVTRFIGYGGTTYQKTIAELCHFYITTTSFAPLLPLALTHEELLHLSPEELSLYKKGVLAINEGKVQV